MPDQKRESMQVLQGHPGQPSEVQIDQMDAAVPSVYFLEPLQVSWSGDFTGKVAVVL